MGPEVGIVPLSGSDRQRHRQHLETITRRPLRRGKGGARADENADCACAEGLAGLVACHRRSGLTHLAKTLQQGQGGKAFRRVDLEPRLLLVHEPSTVRLQKEEQAQRPGIIRFKEATDDRCAKAVDPRSKIQNAIPVGRQLADIAAGFGDKLGVEHHDRRSNADSGSIDAFPNPTLFTHDRSRFGDFEIRVRRQNLIERYGQPAFSVQALIAADHQQIRKHLPDRCPAQQALGKVIVAPGSGRYIHLDTWIGGLERDADGLQHLRVVAAGGDLKGLRKSCGRAE